MTRYRMPNCNYREDGFSGQRQRTAIELLNARNLEIKEAEEYRRLQATLGINWQATRAWATTEQPEIAIVEMTDEHLWNTVVWATRNAVGLFYTNNPPSTMAGIQGAARHAAAKTWLCSRPLFRAFVQEGAKREITYPHDVYLIITGVMLDGAIAAEDSLSAAQPWRDPEKAQQQQRLKEALSMSLTGDKRALRQLDL